MTEFRTKINNLVTYVLMNGSLVTVKFSTRSKSDKYGIYSANNDAVAAALKKHPDFGRGFELVPEKKNTIAKNMPEPKAVYADATTTQKAKSILVDMYGINADDIATKADAKRVAAELNISFPNL